jgi:hypothetical protein
VPGGGPTAIVAGHNEFYVASSSGITPFIATPGGVAGSAPFAGPDVRDLAVAVAEDDIYVLYDDRTERREHLGANPSDLVTFGDGAWRWEIVVITEAIVRRIPVPWLRERAIDCSACDPGDLERARALAQDYLDGLAPETLTVAGTTTFLMKAHDLTADQADWALDDELIRLDE